LHARGGAMCAPSTGAVPAPICRYVATVDPQPGRRARRSVRQRDAQPRVEVRRSMRRRSTVSAYREGDTVVVLLPGRMSQADEAHWIATMLQRLDAQEQRRWPTDEELLRRAHALSRRYLDGKARPRTVRWVSNQNARWGSCTPADRAIRLTTRLRGMPEWVLDYVLLHELAHLLVSTHGPRFWTLLDGYPHTQRARGYLEGFAAATRHGADPR
jgi:predicted metal-dependent hydrolase